MEINCTLITNYWENEKDPYELEVFECHTCGFHLGIDSRFMDRTTEPVSVSCPSCGTMLTTLEPEDDDEDDYL